MITLFTFTDDQANWYQEKAKKINEIRVDLRVESLIMKQEYGRLRRKRITKILIALVDFSEAIGRFTRTTAFANHEYNRSIAFSNIGIDKTENEWFFKNEAQLFHYSQSAKQLLEFNEAIKAYLKTHEKTI